RPVCILLSLLRLPTRATPVPYTTLFRSALDHVLFRPHQLDPVNFRQHVRCFALGAETDGAVGADLDLVRRQSADRSADCRRVCRDRKSTRLNSSHVKISYAVFCLKKKNM